jgi:hypothetical protein
VHQLRETYYGSQFSGLLVGLSLYFYHVRELLVCWLFFSVLLVCIMMVILLGELVVYAGESLTGWARSTTGMTPVLRFASIKLPVKQYLRDKKAQLNFRS